MHYLTLVSVDIGEYPIEPEKDEYIKKEIEQLTAMRSESKSDSISIECHISELRSISNSFSRRVTSCVSERLEPYCECTNDEQYLEFEDRTEEAKFEFEGSVDCIKLPEGTIKLAHALSRKFCIRDGLVFQKNFGKLKQDKRSKKAKKMTFLPDYPLKKLYKTFDRFAREYLGYVFDEEENSYGYYTNPNSFWDWYSIGGRWPCSFLVKEDCKEYMQGEYSLDSQLPIPPIGYRWTSAARKKDIQWQAMIEYKTKCHQDRFEKMKLAFATHELPEEFSDLVIKEDGIYERFYSDVAVYLAGESYEENRSRCGLIDDFDWFMLPYYYVDDVDWHSKDEPSTDLTWLNQVKEFYNNLSDDAVLVSVDCHD